MDLSYSLNKDDYVQYYAYSVMDSKDVKKSWYKIISWGVVIPLFFLIALKASYIFWIAYVGFLLLWIFYISKGMVRLLVRRSCQKTVGSQPDQHIDVSIDEHSFKVNGEAKAAYNFAVYDNMLVILMDKDENLIVPIRALSTQDKFKSFVGLLVKFINETNPNKG